MNEIDRAHGTIWAIFGHRLALEGASGRILADLGPEGMKGLDLKVGDTIDVAGQRKPCEIKVATLTLADGVKREIARDRHDPKADPEPGRRALREAGYSIEGQPERRPKHFEWRGTKEGKSFELHVEFDGTIRRTKALEAITIG